MGCPTPKFIWLMSRKPKDQLDGWPRTFERCCLYEDDGPISKVVRAMAHSRQLYDGEARFRMTQDIFLPIANATLNSGTVHGWQRMDGSIHYNSISGGA